MSASAAEERAPATLAEGLDAAGAGALLIVGHGGGEPDLARFLASLRAEGASP